MDLVLVLEFLALSLGFYMAWNIGANDVANAIGTSVGSKALTMRRAVILAAILEFCGAYFAGSTVSETLQKKIIAFGPFESDPMIFVIGMIGALLSTGILLQTASFFALPVSTTHAIVGSVLGFGLFAGGIGSIYWNEVLWICLSWIVSPIVSGCFSYCLFYAIQKWILARSLVTVNGDSSVHGNHKMFVYLQVMSACCVAFAHGANDVSNAIGPVAAILGVLHTHSLSHHFHVPSWLLAFGGVGIVMGLATWGWRVVETIGKKITELTPAKGCAAELGTSLTVFFASRMGLPISTTHALIGAIFGVGLVLGRRELNFQVLKNILFSWIVIFPLCIGFSIVVFCFLKYVFL